jgi:phospholipase/carboxylesterase
MLALDPDAIHWNLPEQARRGRPLLVLLHGRGSDENDLVRVTMALPAGFAVASVRAPIAEGFGWSWFDPDEGGPSGDPHPEHADQAADAVLEWLHGLDWVPPHIGTLGFSQGGAMAVHLMRRDPYRFDFAVNLAGFVVRGDQLGDAALATQRPHVFWGRGADDPLFTTEILRRTEPWLSRHSTLTTGHYSGLGHSVSPDQLRDVALFLQERLQARAAAPGHIEPPTHPLKPPRSNDDVDRYSPIFVTDPPRTMGE